jgi:hypothetical protein
VVLYGCETWSLTLREVHRLRVFENKVLRTIFGTKKGVLRNCIIIPKDVLDDGKAVRAIDRKQDLIVQNYT